LLIQAILINTWRIYITEKDEFSRGLAMGFLAAFVGLIVMGFGANIFVIVRIAEPFWFLAACVMVLPQLRDAQEVQPIEEPQKVEST